MPYRIKRYYAYLVITIASLSMPFVRIDGNHLFLLSFDKKQFHLMGIVFDMQELYLLPFILILLFVGIFALTTIGGRVWCAWSCPQTIFRVIYRDLIETFLLSLRKLKNKQKEPDWSKDNNGAKRAAGIFLWSILALAASSNFMWYFVPPEDFFEYLKNPSEHLFLFGTVLALSGFLIYDIVFLKEDFCIYVCPYSRIQSVLYDDDTVQAIYDKKRGGEIYKEKEKIAFKKSDLAKENECLLCNSCVSVCPTGIDIRKGMQIECINCLECVDACTKVMGALNKPSLVEWKSTNEVFNNTKTKLFRKKTRNYAVVILIIMAIFFVMSSKKEKLLLNINKTTELYKVAENNKVINSYLFLFKNTQSKEHTYRLEIIGEYADKIKIERFKELKLSKGEMAKKVVILSTQERLSKEDKDANILVSVKAYSIDDPKNVFVIKDVVFIYPKVNKKEESE